MKGAQRAVEAWLASIYAPDDVPSDDDENGPTLRWLRRYYTSDGPDSQDVVASAMRSYQLALAEEAAAAALHDLEAATGLHPSVAVEDNDGFGVRILIDGGYTAPSMWALDKPEARPRPPRRGSQRCGRVVVPQVPTRRRARRASRRRQTHPTPRQAALAHHWQICTRRTELGRSVLRQVRSSRNACPGAIDDPQGDTEHRISRR